MSIDIRLTNNSIITTECSIRRSIFDSQTMILRYCRYIERKKEFALEKILSFIEKEVTKFGLKFDYKILSITKRKMKMLHRSPVVVFISLLQRRIGDWNSFWCSRYIIFSQCSPFFSSFISRAKTNDAA